MIVRGSRRRIDDKILRAIRVHTTISDGQFDEGIKPEHLRYLVATIPDARLVVLPKLSHFAMLQDPSAFNSAVSLISRRYVSSGD